MAVPKHLGRDCELSTTGLDPEERTVRSFDVTRAVLDHVDEAFAPPGPGAWTRTPSWSDGASWRGGAWGGARSSDCLRHWTRNGQCYYSDMGHVEACTAETLSPRGLAAQSLAALLVLERARVAAESETGARYALSTANVDTLDPAVSWGTHFNVTVSTALWEDLFVEQRHPAVYGFVTSAIAAAIPFFGAGYLLPFRDGTSVFSLSGRAHHVQKTQTLATTRAFARGLLNSRREPHGRGAERLHLIGFDFQLVSAALAGSFLQCCLAAAEEGFCGLGLYSPVRALHTWSWGLDAARCALPARAALADGRRFTLPAYVREVAERLLAMCEAGLITEAVAPDAPELLARTVELTRYAEEGSLERCAPHLDWAAKLMVLIDLCGEPGVRLGDARTRLADHDFASTAPTSAFWRLWERGLVDPLVERAEVEACLEDGPRDGRGWARGRLIRAFAEDITDIDWSRIELRRSRDRWARRLRVEMPRPDSLCAARFEPVLERARDLAGLEAFLREQDEDVFEDRDPMRDIRAQLATVDAGEEDR